MHWPGFYIIFTKPSRVHTGEKLGRLANVTVGLRENLMARGRLGEAFPGTRVAQLTVPCGAN